MPARITASVNLTGDEFDFESCSSAIGITATKTWKRKIPPHPLVPAAAWSVGFTKQPFESVNDAVEAVLKLIENREDKIKAFASRAGLRISLSCSVNIDEERPVYDLSSDTMKRLSDLGANFIMDIFDYSSTDLEE